jgi:hypothetical protein
MPLCPHASLCPVYPLLEMRALQELKLSYCEGMFERCARIRLGRERRIVPMNLLPDGKMLGASAAPAPPVKREKPRSRG